jgi:hypothetical protein
MRALLNYSWPGNIPELQNVLERAIVLTARQHAAMEAGRLASQLDYWRQQLAERIPALPTYTLTANCRNLPRIGAAVELLSGMDPGYRRFRRLDDGTQPRYYWYTDRREQGALLTQAVRDLRDEGYDAERVADPLYVLAGDGGYVPAYPSYAEEVAAGKIKYRYR